jgi:hypothetical protein
VLGTDRCKAAICLHSMSLTSTDVSGVGVAAGGASSGHNARQAHAAAAGSW